MSVDPSWDASPIVDPLPAIEDLHERHVLTVHFAGMMGEAVRVCLNRHHSPPALEVRVSVDAERRRRSCNWLAPTAVETATHADMSDATEHAAYGLAIAGAEAEFGWYALRRADKPSGADWYLSPVAGDLEDAFRLEVSGINEGDERDVDTRLKDKVKQARQGQSNLPAVACVFCFSSGRMAFRCVE